MPITNLAKSIAKDVEDRTEGSLGRMVTVVESNGHMVRVKFTEEVEAGQSWYPSVVSDIPAGIFGILDKTRGQDGIFIPIGVPYFDPNLYSDGGELAAILNSYATDAEVSSLLGGYYSKSYIDNALAQRARAPIRGKSSASGNQTISTAGTRPINFNGVDAGDVGLSGLVGSTLYSVDVSVSWNIIGGAGTSAAVGFQAIGASTSIAQTTNITLPAGRTFVTWNFELEATSSSGGAITVRPVTVWGIGSYQPIWMSCKVRAERAAT